MGSSGPQALPSSPGAGQRAPSPQEQSGTRAHGLGTVCVPAWCFCTSGPPRGLFGSAPSVAERQ